MDSNLETFSQQSVEDLFKNLDPDKKNQQWAISIITHYYTNYGAYYLNNFWVDNIRLYAMGKQSSEKYRAWFDPKSKKANYVNFLSFDEIVSPIPKLREIVIERMMKVFTKFTATAIDPISEDKKNKDILKLKFQKIIDEDLKEISKKLLMKHPIKSGFDKEVLGRDNNNGFGDIATTYDLDLSKDDERQLYIDIYYKQAVEVAMELALDLMMNYNAAEEVIRCLCEDAVDLGFMAYRIYMDNTTKMPTIRPVRAESIGVGQSRRNDFRDNKLIWVEEWLTINEIAQMAGDDLSSEQLQNMFNYAVVAQNFRDRQGNYLYWNKCTRIQREDYKIRIVYYEIKSINEIRYEQKVNATTRAVDLFKRKSNWTLPANYTPTSSQKEYYAEVIYKGYWQPMTENAFGFGMLYNMNRDDINKQRTEYSIYIERVAQKSMVEQLIPLEDDFMLLQLKTQHAIIMSKPRGYVFNLQGLRNAVSLGVAGYDTEIELVKMFQQTGTIFMSPTNIDGEMNIGNTKLFETLENGLGEEINGYLELLANRLQLMKEICGINDAVDASSQNTEALVGVQKLAAQASYNVTQHLNRGLINILERGATYIAKLIQDIVIYQKENPFAYNFLISALGKYNAAVIESMDEMSTSQFGIKLEVAPTDVEQQFALQALQQAAQKGEIKTSDLLIIAPMIVKNYKLASRIISIRAKRNEAMAVQNQQSQLQMQQQMESAMSQIKLMVAQIQVDGMKQKANIEGLWQSVVAEMKVKGQISGETLKGEREVAAAQQQQIADAISQSSQQAHEKQMQQQQPISV